MARGLKTKITINVSLLLLLSAVITDVLVIVIIQNVMVRAEISRQRQFLETAGHLFLTAFQTASEAAIDQKKETMELMFGHSGLRAILLLDSAGKARYRSYDKTYSADLLRKASSKAFLKAAANQQNLGMVWASFWWHPQAVLLGSPLYKGSKVHGSIAAVVPLSPIYDRLRQYNRPILLYIIINTGLLTVVGLYRIFRIYLRPIDRIVRQADDYNEDDDPLFAFRREDNELNRLSSALNRMLSRIADDKQKLIQSLKSLELANNELQRAHHEIIRAEKMASVGRLAAGIAHEIGNPIGIVLGYLDLLKQTDLSEAEKAEYTQRAENEIQRINTIIRRLLDLARPKEMYPQQISVNALLEDIVDVMRVQPLMRGIQVEMDLKAKSEIIWGNADQLRQVFLNLLLNAADALHSLQNDQGVKKIAIASSSQAQVAEESRRWLNIHFKDNGVGIPEEEIENIFDPFYTTKEPGKGTGLGLAVCYMIIEEMGGTLSAQSIPDRGTTMNIRLPLVEKDRSEPAVPVNETPGGKGIDHGC